MSKTMVAYFSASGETRALAQTLAAVTGGELYEIRPETPYTEADLDWRDKTSRSTVEMKDRAFRPALAETPDVKDVDTLYVGFPIWWGVAPTVVNTFLEACELTGKTVIPFATSGSGGYANAQGSLTPSAPGAIFKLGRVLPAHAAAAEVEAWVKSL